jgi:hypothetical protein
MTQPQRRLMTSDMNLGIRMKRLVCRSRVSRAIRIRIALAVLTGVLAGTARAVTEWVLSMTT